MGGDVDIDEVKGDLEGTTMGGDIEYRNMPSGYEQGDDDPVNIKTMGGDLDLDYPGRRVKAKTMGGDIDVPEARSMDVVTMGGDIEAGKIEDGAKAKTMGGDIEIDFVGGYADLSTMGGDITITEVDGWIKAETMGGDVFARMVGNPDEGKRSVEIDSKSGDIVLRLPGGISASFDIEIKYTKDSRKNYGIDSDFDIRVEEDDEWEKRLFGRDVKSITGKGEVEGGEHRIFIRTVNGNVTIERD
jgi:DUF4097 and DUF4098 domain-containing protein YvlB